VTSSSGKLSESGELKPSCSESCGRPFLALCIEQAKPGNGVPPTKVSLGELELLVFRESHHSSVNQLYIGSISHKMTELDMKTDWTEEFRVWNASSPRYHLLSILLPLTSCFCTHSLLLSQLSSAPSSPIRFATIYVPFCIALLANLEVSGYQTLSGNTAVFPRKQRKRLKLSARLETLQNIRHASGAASGSWARIYYS